MTQEEVALESGLAGKTVYEVEHGKRDPRLGTLRRIANAIGIPVVDLLAPQTPGGPDRHP
jgi:transcriptional regulator with XRE-family HTH domain